jgi:non-homologous end joining protein Ku
MERIAANPGNGVIDVDNRGLNTGQLIDLVKNIINTKLDTPDIKTYDDNLKDLVKQIDEYKKNIDNRYINYNLLNNITRL